MNHKILIVLYSSLDYLFLVEPEEAVLTHVLQQGLCRHTARLARLTGILRPEYLHNAT